MTLSTLKRYQEIREDIQDFRRYEQRHKERMTRSNSFPDDMRKCLEEFDTSFEIQLQNWKCNILKEFQRVRLLRHC